MGRLTGPFAVAAALLTLAACGEDRTTTTDTEPTRVPGPTDTLVVYERWGGEEEEVRERLEVRPDGAARVTTLDGERRVRLDPDELEGLRVAREAVDASRLEPLYGTLPPPAGSHQQTVRVDGRAARVVAGGRPPPELRRVLDVCQAIVRRHAPR